MRYRDPLITLMCTQVYHNDNVFDTQKDILAIFTKQDFIFLDHTQKINKYHCLCGVDIVAMAKAKNLKIVQTSTGYAIGESACEKEIKYCKETDSWFEIR